jgi:hypothetical protein
VTSARRAILVTEEEHRDLARAYAMGWEHLLRGLAGRYDAAGDQPRIRWCVEHGNVVLSGGCPARKYMIAQPCRVVTAIVVLEEDA